MIVFPPTIPDFGPGRAFRGLASTPLSENDEELLFNPADVLKETAQKCSVKYPGVATVADGQHKFLNTNPIYNEYAKYWPGIQEELRTLIQLKNKDPLPDQTILFQHLANLEKYFKDVAKSCESAKRAHSGTAGHLLVTSAKRLNKRHSPINMPADSQVEIIKDAMGFTFVTDYEEGANILSHTRVVNVPTNNMRLQEPAAFGFTNLNCLTPHVPRNPHSYIVCATELNAFNAVNEFFRRHPLEGNLVANEQFHTTSGAQHAPYTSMQLAFTGLVGKLTRHKLILEACQQENPIIATEILRQSQGLNKMEVAVGHALNSLSDFEDTHHLTDQGNALVMALHRGREAVDLYAKQVESYLATKVGAFGNKN